MADEEDISFMTRRLGYAIPPGEWKILDSRTHAKAAKFRDSTGHSIWNLQLTLHWHKARRSNIFVNSFDDIYAAELERVTRHRSACPDSMCQQCGPDCKITRPYLNDKNEKLINEGAAEYNRFHRLGDAELSTLQVQLDARPKYTEPHKFNAIPGWLDKIDQDLLHDADTYDPCCCGAKAGESVSAYRYEKEPNYDPADSCHHFFPLWFSKDITLCERQKFMKADKEGTYEEPRPARCQRILQNCDLHAMVTNNIFVLVDTSVDDINDRISHPNGELPAPGMPSATRFPKDFQTTQRFLEIPYEELAPRCHHEHLESSPVDRCPGCFLRLYDSEYPKLPVRKTPVVTKGTIRQPWHMDILRPARPYQVQKAP